MEQIDPTKPLVLEPEKQEENRNPSWFKPGESGNPNGRPPKGYSITEAVKKMLSEKPEVKAAIIEKIIAAAKGGDMTAAKMIWSYMDGQAAQAIDMTTLGEKMETKTIILTSKPRAAKVTTE